MSPLYSLREKMNEKGIDAVLVFDELNQHYLTSFAFTDGFLLVTSKKAYLVTDFRYYEMATKAVSSDYEILTPKDRDAFIDGVFKGEKIKNVGFEGGFVSYESYIRYK